MNRVTLCENALEPQSWVTHDVEDLCAFLKEHFIEWPQTAKIYLNNVAENSDVTPYDETSIDRLQTLTGHFYVVVYPEGIELILIIVAIAVAAIAIGLSFLLRPHASPNIKNQQQSSSNNELSARQNKERPNERIPDIFGKVRSTPDLLAVPYRIFDSTGTEIEYAYYCIGRGSYTIGEVKDDITVLATIPGSRIAIYSPFTSPNSGDRPQTQLGPDINEPVKYVKPSNSVNGQILVAPNLTFDASQPDIVPGAWVGPFIIGDVNTTDIWLNFTAQSGAFNIAGATGVQSAVTVTIEVGTTPVDAAGNAIGSETVVAGSLTGSASNKQRVGVTFKLTRSGIQSVRCRRTSNTNITANVSVSDEVQWRDCYAMYTVSQLHFGNVTTVQSYSKPTPIALSLKARKLNMLVTRNIPIGALSGGVVTFGSPGPTVNAADIICAVSQDAFIGNRTAAELDIVGIYTTVAAIASYFGTSLVTRFSFTFDDSKVSFEESLADIATAIFCNAYRRGSVIGVFFEKLTNNSSILFNHRNKLPGSETRTVTFGTPNDVDGIELTYVEPNDPHAPDTDTNVTLYYPANQSAINPQRITTIGIRNNIQASLLGSRLFNKLIYQNIVTQFNATEEAAVLNLNERILVADNTRPDTADGEIVDQNSLLLTLSQFTIFVTLRTYSIFLQHYDETVESLSVTPVANPNAPIPYAPDWDVNAIYRKGDMVSYQGLVYYSVLPSPGVVPLANPANWQTITITNLVLLPSAPSLPLVIDPNMYAKTTYQIVSNADARSAAFLVSEKLPQNGKVYQIKAINYDARYYNNDQDFVTNAIIWNGEEGEAGPEVSSGATYHPSLFNDLGVTPSTGLSTTTGTVSGSYVDAVAPGPGGHPPGSPAVNDPGNCIWLSFPVLRISNNTTLHVIVSAITLTHGVIRISVNIDGTVTQLFPVAAGDNTVTIPAHTYLSRVTVQIVAQGTLGSGGGSSSVTITDINIH